MELQIKSIFALLMASFLPTSAVGADFSGHACYVQLLKAQCWGDYQVNVQIIDAMTATAKDSIALAANAFAVKHAIECGNYEHITFAAHFSPSLWEGEEDTWYQAKRVWVVPDDLPPSTVEWGVTLCFPHDFISVPLLPSGNIQDCPCVRPE